MAPKTFTDLLVQAVDQEELRRRLEVEQSKFADALSTIQEDIDRDRDVCLRLSALPANKRHDFQTVIDSRNQLIAEREELVGHWADEVASIRKKQSEAAFARRRALTSLYKVAHQSINRSPLRKTPENQRLPIDFCIALGQVLGYREVISQGEQELDSLRKEKTKAINASSEARTALNSAKSGNQPEVIAASKRKVDAAEEQRTVANQQYTIAERRMDGQRQSQLERERKFFLNIAQPWLVRAGRLPSPSSPKGSLSQGSLSLISRHRSAETSLAGSTEHRRVSAEPEDVESDAVDDSAVSAASVREARRKAYSLRQALDDLRDSYTDRLVQYMITFRNFERARADALYTQSRGQRSFEAAEADVLHDLLQAEANYSWLRARAEVAGLDSLPLSSLSMADASSDGHVASAGTMFKAHNAGEAQRIAPTVRRWARGVAKAADRSQRRSRPSGSFSISTVGSRRPSRSFPDIGAPNQDRDGRFRRKWSSVKRATRQQSRAEWLIRSNRQGAAQSKELSHCKTHPAESDSDACLDAWTQEATIAADTDALQWSPVMD